MEKDDVEGDVEGDVESDAVGDESKDEVTKSPIVNSVMMVALWEMLELDLCELLGVDVLAVAVS